MSVSSWRIDVIILTWNDDPEMLQRAVSSALTSQGPFDLRVIVVDNSSDAPAAVHEDPRVAIIRNEANLGVAGGRNVGMAHSDAPLALFLDSDAELATHSLGCLLSVLTGDDRIGMTVPVFVDQRPEASAGAAPNLRTKIERFLDRSDVYGAVERAPGARSWDVDFGIGACQLLRRAMYDSVGGLDESLWWADDVDFCLRARNVGWRVVQVDGTDVVHPPRRRFRRSLDRKSLAHGWAVIRYLVRHRGRQAPTTIRADGAP